MEKITKYMGISWIYIMGMSYGINVSKTIGSTIPKITISVGGIAINPYWWFIIALPSLLSIIMKYNG